jgi:hypothetical protein
MSAKKQKTARGGSVGIANRQTRNRQTHGPGRRQRLAESALVQQVQSTLQAHGLRIRVPRVLRSRDGDSLLAEGRLHGDVLDGKVSRQNQSGRHGPSAVVSAGYPSNQQRNHGMHAPANDPIHDAGRTRLMLNMIQIVLRIS